MGHIAHHPLCFVNTARMTEMMVVIKHIPTKTAPMIIRLPPERIIRTTRKLISNTSIAQRNQFFAKNLGTGLFALAFDMTISRNAPLGHKFQHQYLALKNESTRKKAIIPTTKYPRRG